MTDLEMTKLTALAMGYTIPVPPGKAEYMLPLYVEIPQAALWHPLQYDAQAMALVKKFNIEIVRQWRGGVLGPWLVGLDLFSSKTHTDLNRAIVECVAKMQKEKTK